MSNHNQSDDMKNQSGVSGPSWQSIIASRMNPKQVNQEQILSFADVINKLVSNIEDAIPIQEPEPTKQEKSNEPKAPVQVFYALRNKIEGSWIAEYNERDISNSVLCGSYITKRLRFAHLFTSINAAKQGLIDLKSSNPNGWEVVETEITQKVVPESYYINAEIKELEEKLIQLYKKANKTK